MSRKRMFLTFAAEIEHFQEERVRNGASAQGVAGAGKHCFNGILSFQALGLQAVIPFAVKNDGAELLTCRILNLAKV